MQSSIPFLVYIKDNISLKDLNWLIMKKRIGEMGDKIFHQNVNYRKHLGLSSLVRCVKKSEHITVMFNQINCRTSSCESIYCEEEIERKYSTFGKSETAVTDQGNHSCQIMKEFTNSSETYPMNYFG